MSVKDHGLESIRKSTIVSPTEGDPTEYCIRVCQDGTVEISGNIGGSVQISGLSVEGKNTTLEVSTTAIPLPATALTGRNALSVRNLDATTTLYVGFSTSLTADSVVGVTSGWQVGPNETYNVDIQDDIVLFGIVTSGTIKIQVQEFA